MICACFANLKQVYASLVVSGSPVFFAVFYSRSKPGPSETTILYCDSELRIPWRKIYRLFFSILCNTDQVDSARGLPPPPRRILILFFFCAKSPRPPPSGGFYLWGTEDGNAIWQRSVSLNIPAQGLLPLHSPCLLLFFTRRHDGSHPRRQIRDVFVLAARRAQSPQRFVQTE